MKFAIKNATLAMTRCLTYTPRKSPKKYPIGYPCIYTDSVRRMTKFTTGRCVRDIHSTSRSRIALLRRARQLSARFGWREACWALIEQIKSFPAAPSKTNRPFERELTWYSKILETVFPLHRGIRERAAHRT